MEYDMQALAAQIGDAARLVGFFGIVSAWFSRQALDLVCGLYHEYRAGRRWRRMRRRKLLTAAKAYASGRTDLGTATGFDPRFLDAINQLDVRNRRDAKRAEWEAQQASAGR